jgi:hypothetical protein
MITNNTRTKCKSRPDLDPNRSLESLNPRASADIHVNDPRFLKSMMDSNSYPGDSASSNASSYSSSSSASSSGGGGGASGRRSDMSVTSLQEVDESFEPGPFSKSAATQLTQVAVPVETSSAALHEPLVPSSPSSSPSAAFRLMAAIPLLHSSSSSSSPSQNDELIRVINHVCVCVY